MEAEKASSDGITSESSCVNSLPASTLPSEAVPCDFDLPKLKISDDNSGSNSSPDAKIAYNRLQPLSSSTKSEPQQDDSRMKILNSDESVSQVSNNAVSKVSLVDPLATTEKMKQACFAFLSR